MCRLFKFSVGTFLLLSFLVTPLQARKKPAKRPRIVPIKAIKVKVVVVSMFEVGEDTGDIPGEYQLWVEREHLDQILDVPAGYHHVRLNKDGVLGMVRCVRSALPLLRKAQWARIVNFSAHSTQRQSVMLPAYTAAKSMLTSVSKNLSLLLAKDEIMVNVVSPGSIASESLVGWAKSVGVDGDDPYLLMEAIDKHFGHPAQMPRAGLPEEIGPVAAFLASRRNSYMTGANINVDGGSDFT